MHGQRNRLGADVAPEVFRVAFLNIAIFLGGTSFPVFFKKDPEWGACIFSLLRFDVPAPLALISMCFSLCFKDSIMETLLET